MKNESVEYSLSLNEFLDAWEWHFRRHDVNTRFYIVAGTIASVFTALFLMHGSLFWGVPTALCSMYLVGMGSWRRRWLKTVYSEEPLWREKRTAEISEDGIRYISEGIESKTTWKYYEDMEDAGEYLLFYRSRNNFQIIPKKAFAEGFDLENLKKEIVKRIKEQ